MTPAARDLVVSLAAPGDADAIVPLMVEFNRLEGIPWTPAAGRPALLTLLGSPDLGHVYVARLGDAGGPVVGYAIVTWGFDLEWNGRDCFLTELFLDAAARGAGRGRALLDAVEAGARAAGARAMHLLVRHDNTVAASLYRGAGFVTPPRAVMSKVLVKA